MKVVSWPVERFYWTVVGMRGWRRAGPAPPGLVAALADDVPLPVSELHAVCAPLPDGRVVVCAAERRSLQELPTGTAVLHPACAPEYVGAEAVVVDGGLNLLVGDFEPRPARLRRFIGHMSAAATLLVCATLVAVGLFRRAHRWETIVARAREARAAIVESVAPGLDESLLPAELARARQLDASGASATEPADAVAAFAELLKGWPTAIRSIPQSLSVTGNSAVVAVNIPGDPGAFLTALRPPAGWALEEPRLNSAGGTTRLSLVMHPAGLERSR